MFDQCLKFLIIIGLYSAVAVRGYYANYDEYATTTTSTTGLPTTTSMTETSQPTTTQRILGRDEFDLDCTRYSKSSSTWWNDPSPNQSWLMTPLDDDDIVERDYNGYPFSYWSLGRLWGNSSFRLISPIYSRVLDKNGCISTPLSISYSEIGFARFRLYQKPDYIALEDLIAYSDETKKDYILFEVWGYYNDVKEAPLKHFDSNFQLIFEAIHDIKVMWIDIGCVNITQSTNCAGNTGKSTTTMSTTTTRPMRENDLPPASPPSNLWPTTTRPTTTQTLQEGNGDTTTDEDMISDEWVDSPTTSPLSNLWPTTTRPTTKRPTTMQTLQEGNCFDSRNTQMISIISILGIVSLTLVCVLAAVLARQRGTYRLNDLWANIAGTSLFIGHEAKPCDARYSSKDGDDVVIDCNESKQQICQNTEIDK